jgi:NTE family protein
MGYSTNRNLTMGLGSRFEWTRYKPSISSTLAFKGTNDFATGYIYFKHNSLDRPLYPKKGVKAEVEGDWVFQQNPGIQLHFNNQNLDTAASGNPYPRLVFRFQSFTPLGLKSTLLFHLQTGINFRYKSNIMNEFSIGGLTSSFHNQVTFAGLREGSFYSASLAAAEVGFRYQLFSSIYLTGRANMMFNNFISKSQFYKIPDFLSGYALTFTYNFALGPLELSAMYSDQWKRVMGYVNIGIPF